MEKDNYNKIKEKDYKELKKITDLCDVTDEELKEILKVLFNDDIKSSKPSMDEIGLSLKELIKKMKED